MITSTNTANGSNSPFESFEGYANGMSTTGLRASPAASIASCERRTNLLPSCCRHRCTRVRLEEETTFSSTLTDNRNEMRDSSTRDARRQEARTAQNPRAAST